MTDPNELLRLRTDEVTAKGTADYGEATWNTALRGVAKRMADGELTQADLVQKVVRPDAAQEIFKTGMDATIDAATNGDRAADQAWRQWRDAQPLRKARIDRTR